MGVQRRRALAWVGLTLLVVGAAAVEVYVLRARNRDSVATLVQALLAVATFALPIAALLWKWGRRAGTGRLTLADAATQLAEQVRALWESEAAARRLTTAPIPVRWQWSPQPITGSVADVASGCGVVRFAPLPGMEPVTQQTLESGGLKDLFGVYGGLGSGRLVILGAPGSGKSGAAILLLLDALKHRASTEIPEKRAQVPVPVLFTVHGWDPHNERLTHWLAERLVQNNDFLRAPEYGSDTAARLIGGGYVSVILDGLDEMPEELRSVALRALDTQATFRLVVLTRSEEMVAAVSGAHLRGAAALELLPIDATQAADYLARCQIQPLPQPWQALIIGLGQDADSAVAQALDNPLMLTLVRDIYGSGDQSEELVDSARFPTRGALEDHLLDQVLPAAYARGPGEPAPLYTADQAQQWLGYLARCMNQDGKTRDLAWWQIPRWVPVWPRALTIVVVLDLAYGIYGLVLGLVSAGLTYICLLCLLKALLAGLSYALMFGLGYALAPGAARDNTTRIRKALLAGLLIGLTAGFSHGLGDELQYGLRHGFVTGIQYGLVVWFMAGFGFVLVADRDARLPRGQLRRRRWWNRTELRATFTTGIAAGLTVALIVGIANWLIHGGDIWIAHGLAAGLIAGLGVGFALGLGRRSRQQSGLPPSNRSDTRTILMVTIIGFAIALLANFPLGFTFVVVVALGGRPPRLLGRRQWTSAARRTTLMVGLGTTLVSGSAVGFQVGLLKGLWFGAAAGLAVGLGFGLVFAVLTALGQPSTEATSPTDPRSLWNRERQFGLRVGIGVGLAVGLLVVLQSELPNVGHGLEEGLVLGPMYGLVFGLGVWLVSSATWTAKLACAQLRHRGGTPTRLLRFLDDARDRQVLRTVGPVYQFRHARLQDRLAGLCKDMSSVHAVRGRSLASDPAEPAPNAVTGGLDASETG